MKSRIRAYHTISVNRSLSHLLAGFGLILLPLLAMIAFSLVSGIAFSVVFDALFISSLRLFVAFIIATVIAWVLVVWLIQGKTASPTLAFFDVMQSLPTFTIL